MGKRSGPQIEIQIVGERPESVSCPAYEPYLRAPSAVVFILRTLEVWLARSGNFDRDEIVAPREQKPPESTDR